MGRKWEIMKINTILVVLGVVALCLWYLTNCNTTKPGCLVKWFVYDQDIIQWLDWNQWGLLAVIPGAPTHPRGPFAPPPVFPGEDTLGALSPARKIPVVPFPQQEKYPWCPFPSKKDTREKNPRGNETIVQSEVIYFTIMHNINWLLISSHVLWLAQPFFSSPKGPLHVLLLESLHILRFLGVHHEQLLSEVVHVLLICSIHVLLLSWGCPPRTAAGWGCTPRTASGRGSKPRTSAS